MSRVQNLVLIFVGVCGAAIGAAAYFALGFTPIEAVLLAVVIVLAGVVVEERKARRRAFARLERGVEEMGHLLATDAKAGDGYLGDNWRELGPGRVDTTQPLRIYGDMGPFDFSTASDWFDRYHQFRSAVNDRRNDPVNFKNELTKGNE